MRISIIIPAYNESKRLPPFLDLLVAYCTKNKNKFEIIIVDDGSRDKTVEVVESYKSKFKDLHIIRLENNMGKGYAVKKGLWESKGEICVFLDADGAVSPEEIGKNLHYILEQGYDIFIGSRVLKDKTRRLEVKWYRKLIGILFNFLVRTILFREIKDTQCGFKIFKKEIIEPLLSRSYLSGFGFDIEILYLAYKMGYKVKEGPVSWRHINGSKINLFGDSLKMFFNILQVRNWHCVPINTSSKYLGPNEYRYMYEMEDYHWWFFSRRNLVLELIKSLRISSPTILDVGCGTGRNLLEFVQIGKSFGIDINEQAIEFCKKRGLDNVAQSPAERIDFGAGTFDIITCLDLLEHVANPVEVLLELKRLLKDDGKVIITVPAFRILWSQHDEALCHLRRYEKYSLLNDLRVAGFKIKAINYFFFLSFFVVAPIRISRRFFSRSSYSSDTTTQPPNFLNEVLKLLFKFEIKISSHFRLPFGTTLYTVVSK